MSLLREYIKEMLLESEQDDFSKSPVVKKLAKSLQPISISDDGAIFSRSFGDCIVELSIFPEGPNEIWVDKIETFDSGRNTNRNCFRKGYATKVLEALTTAADGHGVTLTLIAAPEAWQRRQYPDLPDKDELAAFYSRFGFVETSRNYAQVYMERKPRQ